ncbi:MAG: copper homeostasis protein CutC [Cyclobacteriaceae bacterium]|nr:copper homeostasis protein CutC [Cyclobacteriaceae bacterium]
MTVTTEIVVFNIESAMNAQKGGADRIELCDNPAEGGTTPSYGVMDIVRQALSIDVYAMIRPRGGDFVYSSYEYHAMKRDIEMCKRASLDGVVFGILKPDGTLDKERCKKLIDAARPMNVTCHRAFDVTRDPFEALEDCIEVGFDRILTSGQAQTAPEGLDLIKKLVAKAGNRISIMPGSGIHEENAKQIIDYTGAKEIHFSGKEFHPSAYQGAIRFTDSLPEQTGKFITNPDKVRKVVEMLREENINRQ